MWEIHEFSSTLILCEINLGDFRTAKTAILTISKAFTLDSWSIFQFAEPVVEIAFFELQKVLKLISHRI